MNTENTGNGPFFRFFGMDLSGRRVVCAGGGRVATRRVEALMATRADIMVVSPDIGPGMRRLLDVNATNGAAVRITWMERGFVPEDLVPCPLAAIAATNDPNLNARIAEWCREAGILCNRADDSGDSSLVFPSTWTDGESGVMLSAFSGGAGPVFSRWLIERMAREFGESGASILAVWLREHRSRMKKGPEEDTGTEPGAIREIHQAVLDSDIPGLLREGKIEQARERFERIIGMARQAKTPGKP